MGWQLLGEIRKAEHQNMGVLFGDAAAADALHHFARPGSRGNEAAVLEGAARLRPGERPRRFRRAAQRIESVEPVFTVEAGEIGVADGRSVSEQPLLEA